MFDYRMQYIPCSTFTPLCPSAVVIYVIRWLVVDRRLNCLEVTVRGGVVRELSAFAKRL